MRVLSFLFLFCGVILIGCTSEQETRKNIFDVKFYENKEGTPAQVGNYVTFHYSLFNEKGDTLASSYNHKSPLSILLEALNEQDLMVKLISQMSEGDSAAFFTNAESYYASENLQLPDSVDADNLYEFRVKLYKVLTPEERLLGRKEQEDKLIMKYLLKNYPDAQKDEQSGLYVIYEKKGKGFPAQVGDSVRFKYTTQQLNGGTIDSSGEEEVGFILGEKQVILGWQLAFTQFMNKGTKATLILPSHLAFGGESREITYGNRISTLGPFTILKCEVELTNIFRRQR